MPSAPRQGTGYINWDNFVHANEGSARRVSDDLQRPYTLDMGRANASYGYGTSEFGRDVEANTLGFDASRIPKEGEALGGYSYGGPNSAMDNQQFASGMTDAQHAAQGTRQLQDIYGRAGLLKQFYGAQQPTYTAGRQAFDAALLGNVGQGGYEAQAKQAGGILDRYTQAQSQSVNTANAARAATAQAAGQYRTGYEGYRANQEAQAQNEARNRAWNPGFWSDDPMLPKLKGGR